MGCRERARSASSRLPDRPALTSRAAGPRRARRAGPRALMPDLGDLGRGIRSPRDPAAGTDVRAAGVDDDRADHHREVERAVVADPAEAPREHAPRARASRSCRIVIAESFGAPVMLPAGKVASSRSPTVVPGAEPCPTRCSRADARRGTTPTSSSASTPTVPGLAHAREVVAHEVDDHDVLGALLLARRAARPRARRRSPASAPRGRVPLIGRVRTMPAADLEEPLGARAGRATRPDRMSPPWCAGVAARRRGTSSTGSTDASTENRVVRHSWYASPSRIASRHRSMSAAYSSGACRARHGAGVVPRGRRRRGGSATAADLARRSASTSSGGRDRPRPPGGVVERDEALDAQPAAAAARRLGVARRGAPARAAASS